MDGRDDERQLCMESGVSTVFITMKPVLRSYGDVLIGMSPRIFYDVIYHYYERFPSMIYKYHDRKNIYDQLVAGIRCILQRTMN